MTTPLPEELEGLASRLALLTSDDGEAENAGRAVAHLARRLGLSGGQLKAIFLAGVHATGAAAASPDVVADDEMAELRGLLDRADGELRASMARIVELEDQNEVLREALDRARVTGRVARVAAIVVIAAGLIGGAAVVFGPALRSPPGLAVTDGTQLGSAQSGGAQVPAGQRMALAGPSGTTLFSQPDRASQKVGRLPAGAPLPVTQLIWREFVQWVETESAGRVAFAPATEVDLR